MEKDNIQNGQPNQDLERTSLIEQYAENPAEAAIIEKMAEIADNIPGQGFVFASEMRKGIDPDKSLEQFFAEENFGATAGDEPVSNEREAA